MSRFRRIAQITRAKGLNGEVVAVLAYSLPLHFWDDLYTDTVRLHIVPPTHDLPRETELDAEAVILDGDAVMLKLIGVDDRTAAQKIVGRYLMVDAKHCPEAVDTPSPSSVGMQVIDNKYGYIGNIVEERVGAAQNIWVLKGEHGEVLIPVVAEFIISRDAYRIEVDLPNGLLELNA